MATPRFTPAYVSKLTVGGLSEGTTRSVGASGSVDLREIPELCGFKDRTTPFMCPTGSSLTCMFNTDIYAGACCRAGVCDWATTCCGYARSLATNSLCGNGFSYIAW